VSRRLRLGKQRSEARRIVQALTFVAALAIGGLLGWILFLAPRKGEELEATLPLGTAGIPDQQAFIVETTGTPASSLGGVVRVGSIAPDFSLPDLNGEMHSLGEHRGEAVILNFWTTWCPPCRFEMPALQQAYERYSDQGFVILAVDLTESDDRDLVGPYREELGLTFPILLDLESTVSGDLYRVLGLPTSVFIDRGGIVREIFIGALPLDELEDKVQSIMGDGE
jgi:cytochrome c biogenesis protein CcmG, thiol:disulfide interchange protein DsbE